ncbi:MAG: hypothetical protein JXO22_15135 [Phycisphaerae bacterium]|nr:hypothetical protein [Phycisphaerae bacterium]
MNHDANRNTRRPLTALVCGAALLACTCLAGAQPAAELTSPDRALLERVCHARAVSDLTKQVRALPLRDGATVGDWAATSVALDRGLRLELRTLPRAGAVRVYSDHNAEVDVTLSPEQLRDMLDDLQRRYPPPSERVLSRRVLQSAAQGWPRLWSTGDTTLAAHSERDRDAGWENVTPEGIELARRAAAADARLALLDEAGGLKVTNARRLDAFLTHSSAVRQAVLDRLSDRSHATVTLAPDQVAEATAEIRITDLIGILSEVYRDHYDGNDFQVADFREMALHISQPTLAATGLATPPDRYVLKSSDETLELDAPAWAGRVLKATGRFVPDIDTEPPAEEAQIGAARLDAIDQLRQQVAALILQKKVTIGEFLGDHRELKDDVVTFLTGARVVSVGKPNPDGSLDVQVELPARRLWRIAQHGMQRVEVEPPEDSQAQPGSEGDQP